MGSAFRLSNKEIGKAQSLGAGLAKTTAKADDVAR
jgi:hypothetical protein